MHLIINDQTGYYTKHLLIHLHPALPNDRCSMSPPLNLKEAIRLQYLEVIQRLAEATDRPRLIKPTYAHEKAMKHRF